MTETTINGRSDRCWFKTKEEAEKYRDERGLTGYHVYAENNGMYRVLRFRRDKKKFHDKVNLDDLSVSAVTRRNEPMRSNMKALDGNKIQIYLEEHKDITKKELGALIFKSRAYVNDCIRFNRGGILEWNTITNYLGLPHDYFDLVEEIPEVVEKPDDIQYDYNNIHDDLVTLIASNKRLEALMLQMIEMWRND